MKLYFLSDNKYVLVTDKQEPSDILLELVNLGYFDGTYDSFIELLLDYLTAFISDLEETKGVDAGELLDKDPEKFTKELYDYIYHRLVEDEYNPTETDDIERHICENINDIRINQIPCKELLKGAQINIPTEPGLYDVRDLLIYPEPEL